jgi:NADH-quinone oxidoreductase subunit L
VTPYLPFLPAAAAALTALLCVARRRNGGWAALPVLLATAAVIPFAVVSLFSAPMHAGVVWVQIGSFTVNAGYIQDPLSSTMLVVVSTVSFLVQLYSVGYMRGDDGFARYFTYMGLFVAAMLGLVIADNLLLIYICWELVGICSYLLIGFWYRNRAPANAAKKAFIVTRFGDLGLLLGIVLIWNSTGTFDIQALATRVGTLQTGFLTTVALLVFFGAMGKSAQFPLHVWLPDAMEGPTPVSALIHAATMVAAGVFLVARLFFLFQASPVALGVVASIGTLTALMAATIALVQNDIKRVLAYSTISQLGYMMLGLGVGGVTVGIFHLGTHAFFKALLFLCAGSVIHAAHTQDMREMGGLHDRMKVTSWTTIIGALALAGIAPLSGFWSKDEILASAFRSGNILLLVVGVAVAGLTAFYMFRLWYMTFSGSARSEGAAHAHESPFVMALPLVVLASLAVVAGAVNLPGSNMLTGFLTPGAPHEPFLLGLAAVSLGVALLGVMTAVALYRGSPAADPITRLPRVLYNFLAHKWYIDDFFEGVVARLSVAWAGVIAWIDRRIVNGFVDLTAWACGLFGGLFRLATSGQPQFYVAVVVIAAALAAWFFKLSPPTTLWVGAP